MVVIKGASLFLSIKCRDNNSVIQMICSVIWKRLMWSLWVRSLPLKPFWNLFFELFQIISLFLEKKSCNVHYSLFIIQLFLSEITYCDHFGPDNSTCNVFWNLFFRTVQIVLLFLEEKVVISMPARASLI